MTPMLLVLRALGLGDLLVAVPALRGLRRAYPGHRLVLATSRWLTPVADLIGGIDELLPVPGLDAALPFAAGEVDIAVNMHGSGARSRQLIDALEARRTMVHRVPTVDGAGGDRLPAWRDDLNERERWTRLVGAFGVAADPLDVQLTVPATAPAVEGATVVHVGAAYGARRWPQERFAVVARALADAGHDVIFTGSDAERERAARVAGAASLGTERVLAGRTALPALAALIAGARLVVSADTGAAHLASAYRRPSVVIFGPASPGEWGPPPGPHVVLTDERLRRGDVFAPDPDPALLAVSPQDVLAAVARLHV
ncbi:glycosyltransferase family 9 protein [Microbacterium horticulturae]|uniref:Glycosyltransferase family 9 protein n=1 Tax=Microbacterium horticulturae TaxID=3028316 RepID=A0ABY8BZ59_9MICO|nr:glycosyltransferase family 9 protein [Microbacterium sp. KACC 23027]WEG09489.1 glycosyltransferase family 9 protein [Microbacterium sp. KACC 23027]